jgi:hypothetical protein
VVVHRYAKNASGNGGPLARTGWHSLSSPWSPRPHPPLSGSPRGGATGGAVTGTAVWYRRRDFCRCSLLPDHNRVEHLVPWKRDGFIALVPRPPPVTAARPARTPRSTASRTRTPRPSATAIQMRNASPSAIARGPGKRPPRRGPSSRSATIAKRTRSCIFSFGNDARSADLLPKEFRAEVGMALVSLTNQFSCQSAAG